ncbi:MAG: hypothetical protein IPI67_02700 [Myxococcales bacterium]|nr:hypothetical protein [Myxococcales bacterium]
MLGRTLAAVTVLSLCVACSSDEQGGKTGTGGTAGTGGATGGASSGGSAGASGSAGAGGFGGVAPYSVPAFDKVRINSDSSKPNFQRASTDADFGAGPFTKATLVVDLGTSCFPFEGWKDNPPPSGQNWPANCDAFDRNFELLLDPPSDPKLGPPALELMRAITPFGGPLHLEIDVTDVINARPGKHPVDVTISTWSDGAGKVSGSDGGWWVTARFDLVPGKPPRNVLAVVPLTNVSSGDPTPIAPINFDVPQGTTSTRLEYRVTGHGGVVGAAGCGLSPAEEFCLRSHTLYVDEAVLDSFSPWRDDCATLCTLAHQDSTSGGFDYCKENPCGAISSVKASRANWCPGSLTPPLTWEPSALTSPGAHNFRWQVEDIASGGSWRVSATFFAFGP